MFQFLWRVLSPSVSYRRNVNSFARYWLAGCRVKHFQHCYCLYAHIYIFWPAVYEVKQQGQNHALAFSFAFCDILQARNLACEVLAVMMQSETFCTLLLFICMHICNGLSVRSETVEAKSFSRSSGVKRCDRLGSSFSKYWCRGPLEADIQSDLGFQRADICCNSKRFKLVNRWNFEYASTSKMYLGF